MLSIRVQVDGAEGALAALEAALSGLVPAMEAGVMEAAEILHAEAVSLVPRDTGELKESIVISGGGASGSGASATVAATAAHAGYVEHGTAKGMAAQPYMFPAYQAKKEAAANAIIAAVQRAVGG